MGTGCRRGRRPCSLSQLAGTHVRRLPPLRGSKSERPLWGRCGTAICLDPGSEAGLHTTARTGPRCEPGFTGTHPHSLSAVCARPPAGWLTRRAEKREPTDCGSEPGVLAAWPFTENVQMTPGKGAGSRTPETRAGAQRALITAKGRETQMPVSQ